MADDEKMARAAEIDAAVKKADEDKAAKAKADAEGGEVSLKDVLAAIGKCSDAIDGHGKALSDMGDRLTALEAGPAADGDPDPDGTKAKQAAVDAKRRADADTPEMRKERADAQMACDSVALAWGERAPAPLVGEDLVSYRCRLLAPYKRHSAAYAELDLHKLAAAGGLDIAERQIYADATKAASAPERMPYGQLLAVEKKLDGGAIYRTFVGMPKSWMDDLAGPVRQYVTSGLGHGEGAMKD
jgi:hypothetical protein